MSKNDPELFLWGDMWFEFWGTKQQCQQNPLTQCTLWWAWDQCSLQRRLRHWLKLQMAHATGSGSMWGARECRVEPPEATQSPRHLVFPQFFLLLEVSNKWNIKAVMKCSSNRCRYTGSYLYYCEKTKKNVRMLPFEISFSSESGNSYSRWSSLSTNCMPRLLQELHTLWFIYNSQ